MPTKKKNSRGPAERVDVYELVTEQITALLEQGVVPWRRPWKSTTGGLPMNLTSGKPYRGINVLLLAMQGCSSPYWVTFKQAKALGGRVPKGTKTTPVVFWKKLRLAAEPGERGARQDEHGQWVKTPLLLRYYRVFNTDQLEGLEDHIPTPDPIQEIVLTETRAAAVLDAFHARTGVRLRHGGDRAFYAPAPDRIELPELHVFETEGDYWATRFHEAVHATGHASRLARPAITDLETSTFGSPVYALEELVAEMGAAMLAAHTGLEHELESSAGYIDSWLTALKQDRRLLVTAGAQAQKACDVILDATVAPADSHQQEHGA